VIAVAVPYAQGLRDAVEKLRVRLRCCTGAVKAGATVFLAAGIFYFAAQGVGDPLHAVTDAQNGHAGAQNLRIAFWGLWIVDGARAAAQDDSRWLESFDFLEARVAWQYCGENLLFADAAGDELRVSAAEVEDDDAATFGVGAGSAGLQGWCGGHSLGLHMRPNIGRPV